MFPKGKPKKLDTVSSGGGGGGGGGGGTKRFGPVISPSHTNRRFITNAVGVTVSRLVGTGLEVRGQNGFHMYFLLKKYSMSVWGATCWEKNLAKKEPTEALSV